MKQWPQLLTKYILWTREKCTAGLDQLFCKAVVQSVHARGRYIAIVIHNQIGLYTTHLQ